MFPVTSLFREARRRHYGKNEPSYRRAFKGENTLFGEIKGVIRDGGTETR